MDPDLEIECPHCRKIFRQRVKDITVGGMRGCPHCHERLEFTGAFIFRILRKMDPPRPIDLPREKRMHE